MSEQAQVVALVQNILQSQSNDLRAENQKLLGTMTDTKLAELAYVMINIVKGQYNEEIKQFVITHLRKHLSAFSEEKFKSVWGNISQENQAYIRESLFTALYNEKSSSVRNLIADAIGQIGGTIMSINANNWPNFIDNVFALLGNPSDESIISGLLILENFFSYCPELFDKVNEQLLVVFAKSFEHTNNKVRSAGASAFSGYIISVDKKAVSKLEGLIIPFYQNVYHLLMNDNGNTDGLDALISVIEIEPKVFKKTFNELNELVQNIIKAKNIELGVKRMGVELLITFAERYAVCYRQNKEKLVGLIEMIFFYMIEIDEEITDEWKRPAEGYSEDFEEGDDFETTNFGMTSVDRLIASVGEKQILPLLSGAVQKMLTMSDWRYKYASIMALSQTGEYIDEAKDIKGVVDMLHGFLGDSNPMLKFAACHAIGQISDDLKPHYQQNYGMESFIKLAGLLKDSTPRVVSHAASALCNLIEGMEYASIAQYLPELISALLELSTTGISLVKESALTAIASIADIAKQNYIPYFQKTTEIIFNIIQNHPGKEYKELKGLTIEALGSIAEGIGKEAFQPAAAPFIEYLITVQSSTFEQVDPQKQYVLAGWQRISTVFGKDLVPFLPRILPDLFNIVEGLVQASIKTSNLDNLIDPEDDKGEIKINTYETEETEVAIAMLNVFIKEMGEHFIPYLERTTKIMLTIVQNMMNQSVKDQALTSLPLIVQLVKKTSFENSVVYTKKFLSALVTAIQEEYDTEILITELRAMKEIIENYDGKFFNAEELKSYSEELLKILHKSDERKVDTNELVDAEMEDDEKELLNEEVVLEEETQCAVSEIIGQLFKTHKEMNASLIEYITNNLLPKVFADGLSDTMHKFGIFLIDDMVEFLGYNILPAMWPNFLNVFLKFCVHKSLAVRQAACYGLGIYAQNTPPEVFKPFIEKSLQILIQAADIPKGSESEKTFGNCKDNAVSSFGKIIKAHGASFDPKSCILMWLNYLPLKHDQGEAHVQHQLLTDILINSPDLLISGETPESANVLLKILQIFGDIIQTKFSNASITTKIKQVVNNFKSLPLFVNNYDMFWSKLSQIQVVKLTLLIKEA